MPKAKRKVVRIDEEKCTGCGECIPNCPEGALQIIDGCPKLDDTAPYLEKLTEIIHSSNPTSLTVIHMEVPCCFSLLQLVQEAVSRSGVQIPVKDVTVSVEGEVIRTDVVRVKGQGVPSGTPAGVEQGEESWQRK